MENKPINYERKVVSQTELIQKLVEDYKAARSDEKKIRLQLEMEMLRYYSNAVKGNPKERGKKAFDFAKKEALSQAVQPIPE